MNCNLKKKKSTKKTKHVEKIKKKKNPKKQSVRWQKEHSAPVVPVGHLQMRVTMSHTGERIQEVRVSCREDAARMMIGMMMMMMMTSVEELQKPRRPVTHTKTKKPTTHQNSRTSTQTPLINLPYANAVDKPWKFGLSSALPNIKDGAGLRICELENKTMDIRAILASSAGISMHQMTLHLAHLDRDGGQCLREAVPENWGSQAAIIFLITSQKS